MRTKKVNKFKKASSKLAFLFACAIVVSPCITSLQSCKATSEEIHSEIISSNNMNEVNTVRSNKTMKQANRINTTTYALIEETSVEAMFSYDIFSYHTSGEYINTMSHEYLDGTLEITLSLTTYTFTTAIIYYTGYSFLAEDYFEFSYEFDYYDLQVLNSRGLYSILTYINFDGGEYDWRDSLLYLETEEETHTSTEIEHREEFYFYFLNPNVAVNLDGKFFLSDVYFEIDQYIQNKIQYDEIYQNAYNEGFEDGKIASGTTYADGYSKGFMDAKNQYQNVEAISFEDVLTAIITAPNKIIREGFDFDILGINVGSLIQTCIVIGLIVFCIGMFKKG